MVSISEPFLGNLEFYFMNIIYYKYSNASLIRTPLIWIIHLTEHMFGNPFWLYILHEYNYIEHDSLIRIFSYPDSQLGKRGVQISEGPLFSISIYHGNFIELNITLHHDMLGQFLDLHPSALIVCWLWSWLFCVFHMDNSNIWLYAQFHL